MAKRPSSPSTKASAGNNPDPLTDRAALELLLNSTEDSLLLLDKKLNVLFFNLPFQKLYQNFFESKMTIGNDILSCPWPESKDRVSEICKRVLAGETEFSECQTQRSDHSEHHFRIQYKPARNGSDEIEGIVISCQKTDSEIQQRRIQKEKDISSAISGFFTDKSDLKTCLKLLLSDWCNQFDQHAAEVWMIDSDNRDIRLVATHSSGNALKTSGKQVPFQIDKGLPGKSWKMKQPIFIESLLDDPIFLRKKFAEVNHLTSATAIPVMQENVIIAVLVFFAKSDSPQPTVELSETILSQLAVHIQRKKSEDNLMRFFLYAPELLCIAGPDGYFKKVNPTFTQLLGFEEQELISQPFTNFVHPDDVNNTRATLRDINTGRVVYSFENRYRTKSNQWKWISWSTSEVLNEEGLVFCYGKDITEERKLRDLLDATNELAGIGSWEVDFINNKVYWSPVMRRIHEVDDDVKPDLDLGISFYKEGVSKDKILKVVRESVESGTKWDVELELISAKGNEHWVRIIGEPEFKDGKCVRLYGSMQDIHARKTAELEIEKVLSERNNILESIGDAFFTVSNQWIITYWNKRAEALFNRTKDQVVGHTLWEVFGEVIETPVYQYYQNAMAFKETQHFEVFNEKLRIWYSVSIYASHDGLSVYLKDVTERVLADEQVRQSNERFEHVAKATNDAIWDFDLQTGLITHIGDGFSKLFGYNLEEKIHDIRYLVNNVHPEDLPALKESQQQAIGNKDRIYWEHEYRFKMNDDRYAFVHDRGYIIRDDHGNALRMIGATQDITATREYERSLEILNINLERYTKDLAASNSELEQFAYVASHDLQEPLRMVSSFMTLLEKNYSDKIDERGKQYIYFAVDGANRMKQIILDLLEFSRVGRFSQQKEEINLQQVVDEAIMLNSNQTNEKNALIHVDPLPMIHSHRTPVRQVFQNLIGNALKYTKADVIPQIRISCQEHATEYQFEVCDNGIGISPAYFDKIFILFHRLSRRDEYSGTGIGLSVCKKIVETLGGRIWVESEEGKGSSFFFTLPKHS